MITPAPTVVLLLDRIIPETGAQELLAVQFADEADALAWEDKNPQVWVRQTVRLVPRREALSYYTKE